MPAGAITLFHVRGIRIGVDYSWFVVLFLVILFLSGTYEDQLGEPSGSLSVYVLAVASALLFFASIVLHELGHAWVAIRNGIGISGITLWMFGGVARMERDTDTPGTEFKVAIAGPLVTAAIVAVCVAVGVVVAGPSEFWDAAGADPNAKTSAAAALLGWLADINLLVLIFNLIPAFPLDGGRIARAIAWRRTGDRNRATRFAAGLGQGFGLLLILLGLGFFMVYLGDLIGGLWLALIGFILRGSARGAIAQSEVSSRIEGLSVADVMDREPVAIPEGLSVEQALDEYFLRYRWPWFPVVDAAQHFIGLLDQTAADRVPAVERAASKVGDILARDSDTLTVRDDEPLEAVLNNQAIRRLGALVAVDADGRIRGVLTADAVGRALRGPMPQSPGV
jgi:Zn-dependent protease